MSTHFHVGFDAGLTRLQMQQVIDKYKVFHTEHLEAIEAALDGARVARVLLTHGHPDHSEGAAAFAARDVAAFRRFLAPDTIWMGQAPLHGPDAVMAAWTGLLTSPKPPFSWSPDLVLVLPSGDLARTTGPVLDPDGKPVGRFQSTWRRKPAGGWEIVFDFGTEVCR